VFFAEVAGGSAPFPFSDAWGLYAVLPLYTLHIVFLAFAVMRPARRIPFLVPLLAGELLLTSSTETLEALPAFLGRARAPRLPVAARARGHAAGRAHAARPAPRRPAGVRDRGAAAGNAEGFHGAVRSYARSRAAGTLAMAAGLAGMAAGLAITFAAMVAVIRRS
jgi:hypothetical protein